MRTAGEKFFIELLIRLSEATTNGEKLQQQFLLISQPPCLMKSNGMCVVQATTHTIDTGTERNDTKRQYD